MQIVVDIECIKKKKKKLELDSFSGAHEMNVKLLFPNQ